MAAYPRTAHAQGQHLRQRGARRLAQLGHLATVEDLAQNHPVTEPTLAGALATATRAAACLDRTCWVTMTGAHPGYTPVYVVTAYEPGDPLLWVAPGSLITTRPDGRPEYLPAAPVGPSNDAPRGLIRTAR